MKLGIAPPQIQAHWFDDRGWHGDCRLRRHGERVTLSRRQPLRRGKPLARSSPSAARSAPLARGRRLPPVSAARRRENEERRDVMLTVRARCGGNCEACPVLVPAGIIADPACRYPHPGRDGHELLSRGRAGSITDAANIIYACRPSHEWITTHPRDAQALGLLLPGH